jgi:glycosyltransferase involved in cell wall biosynthesis
MPILVGAALRKISFVQHVRNGLIAPYAEAVRSADAVIVISDFLRREILRFDIEASKVHSIPDEVDTTYYRPDVYDKVAVRRELDIPGHSRVALMIARLAANKRHDFNAESRSGNQECDPIFSPAPEGGML